MTRPHPQMVAAILIAQQAAAAPDPRTLPIAQVRADFERACAAWNLPLPPMEARDESVGGVRCRMLLPPPPRSGLVVFVHGSGWTFGSPATHERFARLIAGQARAAVLVPEYPLAPEHPAPAGIDDVLAVLGDLASVADPAGKVVLCGDSAGANIALAAALGRPARSVAMLSLLYGCFAPIFDTASHARNGDGRFGLATQRMRWYWDNWLGATPDPRAAPLHADLAGLPPCHLLAASLDPLCDDSLLLVGRLSEAGVATRLDIVPGVVHGFLQMSARLEPALRAIRIIPAEIASALAQDVTQTENGENPK